MDEPTTHLDIPSIDALVAALCEFTGTLVFVSHDVHFIRSVAGKVVHVNAGRLTPYAGDYDYYLDKSKAGSARTALTAAGTGTPALKDARAGHASAPPPPPPPRVEARRAEPAPEAPRISQKERRQLAAEARRHLSSCRRKVSELEKKIAELEQRQAALAAELEQPATYATAGRATEINQRMRAIVGDLAYATRDWEEEASRLASLEADAAE
jgi:ATP-binding cassette subfamily F protein 3